jgi:hypothetical protein
MVNMRDDAEVSDLVDVRHLTGALAGHGATVSNGPAITPG